MRSCAWAFLAALLPATNVLADGESTISASPAIVATDAAPAVAPRPKRASTPRRKIPPPRKFAFEPAPAADPTPAVQGIAEPAATKASGDPATLSAPAPATSTAPAAPSAPATASVPVTAPALSVPSTPAPLSPGDPARIAAAAALINLGTTPSPSPTVPTAPTPTSDLGTISSAAAAPVVSPVQSESPAAPIPTIVAEPSVGPLSDAQLTRLIDAIPVTASEPTPLAVEAAASVAAPKEFETAALAAEAPSAGQVPTAAEPTPAAAEPAPAAAEPAATATQATEPAPAGAAVRSDVSVQKAGCSTCGGFHSTLDGPAFHQSFGCSTGQCLPGRKGACAVPANDCDTIVGNFVSNLWQCLCCPDPCYQPSWVPAANASFFADYARPRTVTRLRFDRLLDMTHPDRNQYFLKTTNPNLPITLPSGVHTRATGRFSMDPSMGMSQLYLYQEAATERASFFIEIPYRQINPIYSPTQAGFADLNLGSKALLFDCEMLQVTFQFRTFLPSGNAMNGLGTGHVSLDPSLLASLKLTPDTYFQMQVGNWIPLGGTSNIAGGMAYWLMSFNQVLTYVTPDSPLIATLEMDGYSFQNGGYTKFFAPTGTKNYVGQSGDSYFNIGPGLRQSICNKVDFGGAVTWATTGNHWADPWFRIEMRFLF